MSGLDLESTLLGYADLEPFGADHLLARLQAGDPGLLGGFPLLERGTVPEASTSPFIDRERLTRILSASSGLPAGADDARFVVAGQQVGLLTGPLYTFLKAITIIRLAADLEDATGVRHVPLFWMASEDHDHLEVNRCTLDNRRFVAGPAGGAIPSRRPQVADLSLAEERDRLIAFVGETFPAELERHADLHAMIEKASFESYPALFRSLMESLFGESLLLVEPIALRPLTAPVLARLVEEWPQVLSAFEAGSTVLSARGFTPPLREPGLFEIRDGMRVKVEISADGATLSSGKCSLAEAAGRIRANPAAFSPNAALRPVLQDAVLPVSAMVGGPSELLYLWQIDAVYVVAGVRRALLRPRISATFVEPRIARAARKAGVEGKELLAARRPAPSDDSDAAALRDAGKTLLDRVDRFLEKREDKKIRRGRNTLAGLIDKAEARMRQVVADEAGRGRALFETIDGALRPEGKLQERVTSPLDFVGRYGREFVARARDTLDPWAFAHHLVKIRPGAPPGDRDSIQGEIQGDEA